MSRTHTANVTEYKYTHKSIIGLNLNTTASTTTTTTLTIITAQNSGVGFMGSSLISAVAPGLR